VSVFGDSPVLCGHRGSGTGHAENTLPSFRAAVAAGLEVAAWCPLADERERLVAIGVDCLVIDLTGGAP